MAKKREAVKEPVKEKPALMTTSIFWRGSSIFCCGFCGNRINPPRLDYGQQGFWLDLAFDEDSGQPIAALHEVCAGYVERGEPLRFETAMNEFQQIFSEYNLED